MDRHLDRLRRAIDSSVAGLTMDQLSWHPPGKWCAAEVLEHLYLTYTGTIKGFERMLAQDRPSATSSSWQHRAGSFLVLRLGYMPSGRKTPSVARPRGIAPEKILAEIGTKITEMDAAILRSEQKFGSGKLLDHPILGALSAAEWRKFHLVHGLHHARQIRSLRQRAAPPEQ